MSPLEVLVQWDAAARTWLTTHDHPAVDIVMVGMSIIGRAGAVWLAITLALVLLDRRRLRAAANVLVALSLVYVLTDIVIKPLVARARPFESAAVTRVLDRRPATYSFPSGHAAAAVAGAATLSRLWPSARLWLWGLALLVAFSRIYVGVHYPLDVAGGAIVGFACAWVSWRLIPPNPERPERHLS